ncbi:MAG: hypothetical protein R3Y07_07750 [Eubacteriales bacterium]
MILLWIALQFAPPLLALYIHKKVSHTTYFTKESLVPTVLDFATLSFFITFIVYGVLALFHPNEEVVLSLWQGGSLAQMDFVLLYATVALISALFWGNFYRFGPDTLVKAFFSEDKAKTPNKQRKDNTSK